MSHSPLNFDFVLACLAVILAAPFLFQHWLNRYPVRSLISVDTATGRMSGIIFAALFTGGFVFGEASRSAGKVLLIAAIVSFCVLYQSRFRYLQTQNAKLVPAVKPNLRTQLGKLGVIGFMLGTVFLLLRAPYLAPVFFVLYPFLIPYSIRLQHAHEKMQESSLKTEIHAVFTRAKVKLSEVYIIQGRGIASDAMLAKNTLFVTIDLFQKLNETEILAVVAHEASHLQQNHMWKRMFAITGYTMLGAFWYLFPATLLAVENPSLWLISIPVAALSQIYLISKTLRRQEIEADLGAIRLGASSDALISALHKLQPATSTTGLSRIFVSGFYPSTPEREQAIRASKIPSNFYFHHKRYAYAYSLMILGYTFHVAANHPENTNRKLASSANIAHVVSEDTRREVK